jgi:uridylate kinase
VYSADPMLDPSAERYDHLSYDEVIGRDLRVMDLTAICLCRDHHMPILVLDVNAAGALAKVARGDHVGTLIDAGSGN